MDHIPKCSAQNYKKVEGNLDDYRFGNDFF